MHLSCCAAGRDEATLLPRTKYSTCYQYLPTNILTTAIPRAAAGADEATAVAAVVATRHQTEALAADLTIYSDSGVVTQV